MNPPSSFYGLPVIHLITLRINLQFAVVLDHLERWEAEHLERRALHLHVGPEVPARHEAERGGRVRAVAPEDPIRSAVGRGQVRVPDQHQARKESRHLLESRR